MDNDKHLKKFFMDTYNSEDMYYDYVKGSIILDLPKYSKWHSEQRNKNSLFANYITENERLDNDSIILESALSGDLAVSNFLVNSKLVRISDFSKFKINKGTVGNLKGHYICNGYYNDTLEQIYQILNNGSFTVGICTEKKTKLFKEVKAHYNQLRDFLLRNGYITDVMESNIGSKNRIYLLTYDYYNQRTKK